MAHEHHHHHHHSLQGADTLKGVYIFSIILNVAFVLVEAGVGFWKGSLGLLSDAGHNLGDVFSLLLALVAFRLSTTKPTDKFTYGFRKGSVLISLLNALILLVAVGAILVESIRKFRNPEPVDGVAIAWTAAVGIVINGLTAFLLMRHQKNDINTKGAFLHMAADTLVSAGVVVSGVLISFTGWTFVDPVISILIAVVILVSTWKLLSESLSMSIDAVPEGIDREEVLSEMNEVEGVLDVHHVHIWPVSTTDTALTAHIVVADGVELEQVVAEVKHHLFHCGISHATLETEREGHPCADGESAEY
ncbi:MAG: cation diffusion facilitator family transporter [Bacteroidales bacterium]|nr:cation diffusion facilitator family transporter [Bacteroidales bacterium]